jgi:hypothetical protein
MFFFFENFESLESYFHFTSLILFHVTKYFSEEIFKALLKSVGLVLPIFRKHGQIVIVESAQDPGALVVRGIFLCLVQIFLDPYYCTAEGICTLLEKQLLHHM